MKRILPVVILSAALTGPSLGALDPDCNTYGKQSQYNPISLTLCLPDELTNPASD
ncbi:hypothetical protein [Salinactinospora qingdaonensis]|uniref:Uncharacterized protein n=1 Tax=Salinactinospora qingdaonensis TaxID=702744 RepID=A0ABP7FI82_9ACTN